MTCRHTVSKVINSRPEGHTDAMAQKFRYLQFRRRKCCDCGAKFNTYEMTRHQVESTHPEQVRPHYDLLNALKEVLQRAESGK